MCIPAVPLFSLLRPALSLTLKLTVFHLAGPQALAILPSLSLAPQR